MPTETNVHGDALFMVKTWPQKEYWLVVGGGWRVVAVGGWRLVILGAVLKGCSSQKKMGVLKDSPVLWELLPGSRCSVAGVGVVGRGQGCRAAGFREHLYWRPGGTSDF